MKGSCLRTTRREKMDMVHDAPSTTAKEEEDRISNLPDDIIHRILGFLDIKYAVQTSKLCRRWRRIWTSMPQLNLDTHTFGAMSQFAAFVRDVLSHRNNRTQVFAVKLSFRGNPTHSVFKSIFNYAYSHDIRQLTMICSGRIYRPYPESFFSSRTLKHLTLRYEPYCFRGFHPNLAWDFPVLETLNLTKVKFSKGEDDLNLFSKCVNLKDLTLHSCSMFGVHSFNVCAPQLLNLTYTGNEGFPKVFNVVALQLENFTASVMPRYDVLRLSTNGLDFLEKVNLSSSGFIENNKRPLPPLLDLFQKLRCAKFLILDAGFIEALSLRMDELWHEPCPFNNLKCLKIDMSPLSSDIDRRDRIAKKVPQVRQYLLQNSPDATFIIDLPQVPPMRVKRPMQTVHNYTMANKVAKLDVPTAELPSALRPPSSDLPHQISRQDVQNDATTKKMTNLEALEKQPETRPDDKRMLEAKIQMLEQVIAKQKATFEAKIQTQDEVIAKQKAVFEEKIQRQDEFMAKQRLYAKQHAIYMEIEVIAKQKAMFEAKIQMQDEVISKQKATFEAKTQMVEAAKLQQQKLMSLIIKSKIAELKVKIESGSPSHEVIHSTGVDIGSVMDLIPESLRVKLEARFSLMYEGFKSLLFTHIDDSQWEKIESQLEKEYNAILE